VGALTTARETETKRRRGKGREEKRQGGKEEDLATSVGYWVWDMSFLDVYPSNISPPITTT